MALFVARLSDPAAAFDESSRAAPAYSISSPQHNQQGSRRVQPFLQDFTPHEGSGYISSRPQVTIRLHGS